MATQQTLRPFVLHSDRAWVITKTRNAIAKYQTLIDEMEPRFTAAKESLRALDPVIQASSERFALALELARVCRPTYGDRVQEVLDPISSANELLTLISTFHFLVSDESSAIAFAKLNLQIAKSILVKLSSRSLLTERHISLLVSTGILGLQADSLLGQYPIVADMVNIQIKGYDEAMPQFNLHYCTYAAESDISFATLQAMYRALVSSGRVQTN